MNGSLEEAFIPIDDFYEEIKEVITSTLENENVDLKNYMEKNQYKYFAIVYKFEKTTEENTGKVSVKYKNLIETSAILVEEIDDNAARLQEVLERRGCNDDQIEEFLNDYFDRMSRSFNFEMNHLYRVAPIGTSVGNESFFIHKNIVSGLYDCLDSIDVQCYINVSIIFLLFLGKIIMVIFLE